MDLNIVSNSIEIIEVGANTMYLHSIIPFFSLLYVLYCVLPS